jgi:hypothetical protein
MFDVPAAKFIVAVIALMLALAGQAAPFQTGAPTRSATQQFLAYPPKGALPSRYCTPNSIPQEPALLAISCERIKQSLFNHLGLDPRQWRGKIHIHLRAARFAGEQPSITIQNSLHGWAYYVNLPDALEQTGFVRTMVEALLLEIANRDAEARLAEIPAWLAEGLSRELIDFDGATLMLSAPEKGANGLNVLEVNFDARRPNPLERAKQVLQMRPPLTFEQLSWPAEHLTGETLDVYRVSAQLFVEQLLRLKDGPACLRGMLKELPRRYNWQFAFLAGFQSHFERLLDVEKWWGLQLVQFTGRDPSQLWTADESWRKLNETVHTAIEVRSTQNDLPMHTHVNLQTVIRDWDVFQQTQLLQRKLQELELMRLRVAHEFVPLLDDYRKVLRAYLEKRQNPGSLFSWLRPGRAANRTANEAIVLLEALDVRREALRSAAQQPLAETAQATGE